MTRAAVDDGELRGQPEANTQRRTHVLSLIDGFVGGGESVARLDVVHLDPTRYRRTLCVTRVAEDPADEVRVREELQNAGAELLTLDRRHRADLAPWAKLTRYLRSEQVDILHAHKFGSNVWAALLRDIGRVPVVIAHEHTWSYEGQPLRRAVDRYLIARRSDRMVAVSQHDRRRMIEIEHIDPAKIVVILGGIETRSPSGHDVRQELGLDAQAPIIVSVAGLRPQKALEVLVDAAAQLRLSHPSLRVLIAGEGPERRKLEAMIKSSNLQEVVLLLGRRDDVTDVIAAGDVAVNCSDFEGTPLAVIEYMAAGKPVVATRVGGVPDLVQDGVTGLLVEPRAPAELAAAVGELLSDPPRRAEMGRRGQERQRTELTIEATISQLDDLYGQLLKSAGRVTG